MISLDIKSEAKASSSPLNLTSKEEEPTLSFSELLKGASLKKDDKVIQNGALVLSLGKETKALKTNVQSHIKTDLQSDPKTDKSDFLLSLLKNDTQEVTSKVTQIDELPLEINPQLTKELSVVELKSLVKDAKKYLKEKILASDDFKKHAIKELPKTLKGLAQMAKKFGIDVSKITIEEVRVDAKIPASKPTIHKPIANRSSAEKAEATDAPEVKSVKVEPKDDIQDVPEVKTTKTNTKEKAIVVEEVKSAPINKKEKVVDIAEVKTAPVNKKEKVADVAEVKTAPVNNKEKVAEVKTAPVNNKERVVDVAAINKSKINTKNEDVRLQEQVKVDDKKVEIAAKKTTPLFKAQVAVEHTTEQVIQTKQFKGEHKTPKEKADDTLKLLIGGEKVIKSDATLTSDFSVASAKVIAPKADKEVRHGLEKLLIGDKSDAKETSKTDGIMISKADSFEVKLNEAKQMVKYLSQDVKTAIEDYKSPFTRLKVQLNPQRLGEVDLTIVQRGKNLHINLSSNNTAINTLAVNATDLKTQLSNNGINNATLNFNSSSQGDNSQSQQQQQQRQNEQRANEEYSYFEHQEANEEIVNSLEIVVPHYA